MPMKQEWKRVMQPENTRFQNAESFIMSTTIIGCLISLYDGVHPPTLERD